VAANQHRLTIGRERFLHLQERERRAASSEEIAQFQKVQAVLEEVRQSIKNIDPDPDDSYMSAIRTMHKDGLPPGVLNPEGQVLNASLFGKCETIGKAYRELLSIVLCRYETAMEEARKIPQDIKINGIAVSDFTAEVEKEQSDLRSASEQVVEIFKDFSRVCFADFIFSKKDELQIKIDEILKNRSLNPHEKKLETMMAVITEQRKWDNRIGDPQKWKDSITEIYDRLLPIYNPQSVLNIVPTPKNLKVIQVNLNVELPAHTLQQVISLSLQMLFRQKSILQKMELVPVVVSRGDALSSEVVDLCKNSNRRNSDNHEKKRRDLIEKLDAYGNEHTQLMKEMKNSLFKLEALLEREESGKSPLAIICRNLLIEDIKTSSFAERRGTLQSKNKLLLMLNHVGKDKQDILKKLIESADHLEVIWKHCFENDAVLGGSKEFEAVLGGSKEFSEVPGSLLYKTLSLLIDNHQGLCSSIDQAAADMEKTAATEEEKEVATTLSSFGVAVSNIKEWLEMHLAYFQDVGEKDQYTDLEARTYIHNLFTPEKERLQEQEQLAKRNADSLLAELATEKQKVTQKKEKIPAESAVKSRKAKGKASSSSKQKTASIGASTENPKASKDISMSAPSSATLENALAEWREKESEVTAAKIKQAAEATRNNTAPLDINSPLTDLMITLGSMTGAAERIAKYHEAEAQGIDEHDPQRQSLQAEADKWKNKAAAQKAKLNNLENQDLRLRLEKAQTHFLDYPSGELFTFLLKHKGITSISPRGRSNLSVHRYPCFRNNFKGEPWLDTAGNPVYDWIEPYKIYTRKNKYAVLHAHINPRNASECTALHFKRREEDQLGKQYEIREAEAGNEYRVYRKKANKKILDTVRNWGDWTTFHVVA